MKGVQTHFIKRLSDTEQLNKKVEIIPLEVVLRNVTAGSFSKRFGVEEGIALSTPIVEFYYKKMSWTILLSTMNILPFLI